MDTVTLRDGLGDEEVTVVPVASYVYREKDRIRRMLMVYGLLG